mgnify:CR=1 FL=1
MRASMRAFTWMLAAARTCGVRRSWLRVRLCSRTVSGSLLLVHTEPRSSSLLPVHYISEHRISSTAAVAAGVTGQGGPGDTQLVERGTLTNVRDTSISPRGT